MTTVSGHVLDRLEERVGEFLSSRDAARTDYSEYRDDPERFMQEILAFEPWAKQREICRAVVSGKRVVVRGHHGAGKDAILAALLLWACYAREMLCIVVSATERQVLGQVWAELARLWSDAGLPGEMFVGELRIGGEKRVLAMTSASTSNLTGWHNHRGTGVFVAVSESQAEQVGNAAFDAAEGNTAGEGSRIVVVGNPVKPAGRFYEVSRKATWTVIAISAFDHPNVTEGRVVIPGGPAPGWPEEMRLEYGLGSGFYVSRVLGEFPSEGSINSLVRATWVDAAFDRWEAGGLRSEPLPVVALDVARSWDRDESVAAIAQDVRVHRLVPWRSRDLMDTAERFLQVAQEARVEWFTRGTGLPETLLRSPGSRVPHLALHVDAPGVGGGVIDAVRSGGRWVEEYWGWLPASDKGRYANARAENYWHLRKLLESGKAELPRDAMLREEALAYEYSEDTKGRITMLPKEDLRKSLGRSPDRLDACVIALAATAPGNQFGQVRAAW